MPIEEPLYIGVSYRPVGKTRLYSFFAGKKDELARPPEPHRIVRIVRAPKHLQAALKELVDAQPRAFAGLGHIEYSLVHSDAARVNDYQPKRSLEVRKIKTRGLGLGYYLEMLSTHHLQGQGINFLRTSTVPSAERLGQIKKIGLTPTEFYTAEEWKRALGKGVRLAIKK